ncbi:response regulator transcription factor [Maribacter sp. ACAM166]|uniref:response regulator transcription factor n=1 Tax=Maribacter sp. ACAM166 TaxID=2508996 RepID=UPI0010FD2C99|nr:response regulator [Maribacter sp. ACAM166]TLP74260.1 response regulator [Maribacter sp. ACAM166]
MPLILLIEDNFTILENTAELLEFEGYTVNTAINGNKGFQKATEVRPDLIICDVLMPEMGGFELLAKLGSHSHLKTIPLIFYSANSEKNDIKIGMNLGAYDYVVKPCEITDLLVSIRKCFKRRKIS